MLCLLPPPLGAQQPPLADLPSSPAPQTPQPAGTITGTVVDASGAAIASAAVTLTVLAGPNPAAPPASNSETPSPQQPPAATPRSAAASSVTKTDADGVFSFSPAAAGSFQLLVAAPGFAPRIVSGSLSPGQIYTVPQIALVAAANIDVEVSLTQAEIAQIQLDTEEKQRLFGIVPNFYVTYQANPAPLTPRQKFTLAGKFIFDPVSFGITGVTAGIQQANNDYAGYGQGASGYAKRYAAATGTFLNGILIGNAILPAVFKQDPRYFYKGTGTVKSRALYAIAMSVMCKGDNGRWQVNYSGILGGLAAGGIANAYYPAKDRDGLQLTFVNAAIGTAESAAGNVVQEFLFKRLTSHTQKANTAP